MKHIKPPVREQHHTLILLTVLYTLLAVFIIHAIYASQVSVCEQAIRSVINL